MRIRTRKWYFMADIKLPSPVELMSYKNLPKICQNHRFLGIHSLLGMLKRRHQNPGIYKALSDV